MTDFSFVTVFFNLVNFGLLIGLALYIFNRSLLRGIRDQIKEKWVFHRNLNKNKESLRAQQKKLDQDGVAQGALGKELLGKIAYWSEKASQKQSADITDKEHFLKRAHERKTHQAKELEKQAFLKEVLPNAFESAEKALKNWYENTAAGEKYLAHTFTYLTSNK